MLHFIPAAVKAPFLLQKVVGTFVVVDNKIFTLILCYEVPPLPVFDIATDFSEVADFDVLRSRGGLIV